MFHCVVIINLITKTIPTADLMFYLLMLLHGKWLHEMEQDSVSASWWEGLVWHHCQHYQSVLLFLDVADSVDITRLILPPLQHLPSPPHLSWPFKPPSPSSLSKVRSGVFFFNTVVHYSILILFTGQAGLWFPSLFDAVMTQLHYPIF